MGTRKRAPKRKRNNAAQNVVKTRKKLKVEPPKLPKQELVKVDFRFKVGHDEKYNGPFEALAGWLRGKKTKNINGWILVGINGHLKYEEKVSTFTREDLKEAESIETVKPKVIIKYNKQEHTLDELNFEALEMEKEKLVTKDRCEQYSLSFESSCLSTQEQYYQLLRQKRLTPKIELHLKKDKVDRFRYFKSCSGAPTTSDTTFDDLDVNFQITDKVYESILKKLKKKEGGVDYQEKYVEWMSLLKFGYNILFFGVGSKKEVLQDFFVNVLKFGHRFIINGYHPATSLRELVSRICKKFNCEKDGSHVWEQVMSLKNKMKTKSIKNDIFILINNIDGSSLRNTRSQELLSRLAEIPRVHLIASIDHIAGMTLWDPQLESRFRWNRVHITTPKPLDIETHYNRCCPPMCNEVENMHVQGISHVLKSLTPNHKEVLEILVEQVTTEGSNNIKGLSFQNFYNSCYEAMLVSNDQVFRELLTELIDHNLVKIKKDQNQEDVYSIGLKPGVLKEFMVDGRINFK